MVYFASLRHFEASGELTTVLGAFMSLEECFVVWVLRESFHLRDRPVAAPQRIVQILYIGKLLSSRLTIRAQC